MESILNKLQIHYDYADKYYPNHVLGIFAYGSMNYGFYIEGKSGVDSYAIIIPSFEDIAHNRKNAGGEWNVNGELIKYIDIRVFIAKLRAGSPNALELLYTNYYIIQERFKGFFTFFFNKRELISKANPENTMYAARGQAISYLTKRETTMKDIYNARRLLQFLYDYDMNKPYAECLVPQDQNICQLLWKMRKGTNTDKKIINKLVLDLTEKVRNFEVIRKNEMTNNDTVGLQEHLSLILEESLLADLGVKEEPLRLREIFDELTERELKAAQEIYKRIGLKGVTSIKKLTEETEASRSVYQSVINKLKEYRVIETFNRGQKGLEIEFTTPDVVEFLEDK